MKKILLVLALCCLLACSCISVAYADVTVTPDNPKVSPGDVVVITISSTANVTRLVGIEYNFLYDTTVFEFVSMTYQGQSTAVNPSQEGVFFDQAVPQNGILKLAKWEETNERFNMMRGVLTKITLKVLEDAQHTTDVVSLVLVEALEVSGNSFVIVDKNSDKYALLAAPATIDLQIDSHESQPLEEISATCTQEGRTGGIQCSKCGEILEQPQVLPKIDHNFEKVDGKQATCTEMGLTEGTACSVCGEVGVAQTEIPNAEHSEIKFGNGGIKCWVCDEILVEPQPTEDNTGTIVAIVVGSVVGAGAIFAAVYVLVIRKKKR